MKEKETVVKVGIADLNVITAPHKIRTSGLGSCVGIVLYDSFKQIAGLAHIMLPDSKLTRQKNFNEYKYADTAIKSLIKQMLALGARRSQLRAKLAGGAQMFQFESSTDMMRIGPRNIDAVKKELQNHRIPIISEDLGGCQGRTIEFDPLTTKLKVRTVNEGEKFI